MRRAIGAHAGEENQMSSAPASLLLVDDDPLSLELLHGYLEPEGYRLTVAQDGEEAWNLLSDPQRQFDLVVSDRSMPRMDGMELLQRIKADSRLARLPVIFETALAQQSDIAEGIAAGVHYYLTKPFNFPVLRAVVRAALDDHFERTRFAEAARRTTGAMRMLASGRFRLRTPDEARELSNLIAAGSPRPDSAVLGLSELLLNAVEHGNLGVSYKEKSALLIEGRLHAELARRLDLSPWKDRAVEVDLTREADALTVRIVDQGEGFDHRPYLRIDPERALDPNGRGIAMALMISFSSLEYRGRGNEVVATIDLG